MCSHICVCMCVFLNILFLVYLFSFDIGHCRWQHATILQKGRWKGELTGLELHRVREHTRVKIRPRGPRDPTLSQKREGKLLPYNTFIRFLPIHHDKDLRISYSCTGYPHRCQQLCWTHLENQSLCFVLPNASPAGASCRAGPMDLYTQGLYGNWAWAQAFHSCIPACDGQVLCQCRAFLFPDPVSINDHWRMKEHSFD